jgi:hypothetical protein
MIKRRFPSGRRRFFMPGGVVGRRAFSAMIGS